MTQIAAPPVVVRKDLLIGVSLAGCFTDENRWLGCQGSNYSYFVLGRKSLKFS